jgi:hypothetical protein
MPTSSNANPPPDINPESHDDTTDVGSSFGSQAQTYVQSAIQSMTDNEVPKTGDEPLPSTGGPVPHGPKASKLVFYSRKIYRPLGFHKGYNFPLCAFTLLIVFALTPR